MDYISQGRIQDLKLGGVYLKKSCRAEGGAKIFGVFLVKNHTFSNCGGRCENLRGISCEKSRFYAKNSYFFSILGGAPPPPLDPPLNLFGQINLTLTLVVDTIYPVLVLFEQSNCMDLINF